MRNRLIFVALLFLSVSGASACGTYTDPLLAPSASVVPKVVSFVSRIQEKGSAWRSFSSLAGDVSIQLTSVSQGAVVMGLGFGTLDVTGTNCVVSQSVEALPEGTVVAPQISANVTLGTYCVKIWDVGNLTTIVDFSIAITFPS